MACFRFDETLKFKEFIQTKHDFGLCVCVYDLDEKITKIFEYPSQIGLHVRIENIICETLN